MADTKLRALDGTDEHVSDTAVKGLRGSLRGDLLAPGSSGYDEARSIWNGMIDRRPGLIARCAGAEDVREAVRFAADHGLLTSVRGGGHNIAGNAVAEGGFMIDLSPMNGVRVDPEARTADVGPGATLADLDGATQAHGLATPVGINSTTGIAGLTLGGGFGWLSRKHGMTIDNLLEAEVVTADGRTLRASEEENPDLFWGLRGGGGNFGVVTSFRFRLHEVGPDVLSGLVVYPNEEADRVLRAYREFVAEAPEDLAVWAVLRKAPPLPFLPEEAHGTDVLVLAFLYAGRDHAEGERLVEPLDGFGTVVGRHVGVQPYAAFQQAFDPLLTPGARNYWKSHDFTDLPDGLLDTVVEQARRMPSPQCEIFIGQVGGAFGRAAPEDTAYPHRDTEFVMNFHGRWEDPADDEGCTAWAREFFEATAPWASGSVYVNFLTADEGDRVRAAYGPNYDRLAALKAEVDPDNLFRMNQNIEPA